MSLKFGTEPGLLRRATVRRDNEDGTIQVALNDVSLSSIPDQFTVPLPSAWAGPGGQFVGGSPIIGSNVLISQGEGGQWFVVGYLPATSIVDDSFDTDSAVPSALKSGRALMRVKGGTEIYIDPNTGIHLGQDDNYIQLDPNNNIASSNYGTQLEFTEGSRSIRGPIKRDLGENSNRDILGSALTSHEYRLTTIGLDPSTSVNPTTIGINVRNPALSENREVVYEFAHGYDFTNDLDEYNKYTDIKSGKPLTRASRRNNRTDTLSLSLESPNQLIESIKGTAVDTFGNIVDLNRSPLPIGKTDILSLRKNPDKADAFARIRAQLRKSLAFHWEMNARKGESDERVATTRDVSDKTDYARDASKFFFDLDKEGQFKLNIPASSETGNVPLLTRYENFSVLQAKEDGVTDPNSFLRSEDASDIFLENFAGKANIKLSLNGQTDGYAAPLDRFTGTPIKVGTAFHDITKTINEYQTSASYLSVGQKLVNFDLKHHLNTEDVPFNKIVTDNIIVSGLNANAGGRSGLISLDGMLVLNIGANTVDRQSVWYDTAGGIVANIGRDKQGISYAGSLDGDFLMQVGGPGIGNNFDSRFSSLNDAYRNGRFELRIFCNGQLHVLKFGPTGLDIVSCGTMNFWSQQDMTFKTNSSMKFEAENIVMYAETEKRVINRFPANRTIG